MSNSEVVERIRQVMKQFGLNQSQMAIKTNIKQPNLSAILNLKRPCDDAILNKIVISLDIDKNWLLTGEGEMLRNQLASVSSDLVASENAHQSVGADDFRLVPLVNIDSVGGIHSQNSVTTSEQYIMKMIPFTEAREGDRAIFQSGNSMTPTIPAGSVLLIREVVDWQEYFGYGNIYVLWLRDGRRITKEVRRYDEDPKNYVWCVSYNPDVADEELPRSMIRGVWKVVKYVADFGW